MYLFYVYILMCNDNTLYTGYTVDIDSRLAVHNEGLGAKYTRGRLPVRLVYQEVLASKSDAMKRELKIKKYSRSQKLQLIKSNKV